MKMYPAWRYSRAIPGNNPGGTFPLKEYTIITSNIMIHEKPKVAEPMQSQVSRLGRDLLCVRFISGFFETPGN